MNIAATIVEPRIADLRVSESEITAYLVDGRTISVPLAWSWRLSDATSVQRSHWELIGDGTCVHWPEIDEDISIEGMLHGFSSAEASRILVKMVRNRHGSLGDGS